jgi:hypothetical protein
MGAGVGKAATAFEKLGGVKKRAAGTTRHFRRGGGDKGSHRDRIGKRARETSGDRALIHEWTWIRTQHDGPYT